MNKKKTLSLTIVGVMTAVATVIYMVFPEVPLVPGVEYLKLDFSDIPAILTSILLGPLGGIAVEVIKNIIHLFRTTTAGIGELMNIGIGSAMILSLSSFSRLFAKLLKKDAVSPAPYFLSAVISVAVTILAGWLFNGLLTPVYFKIAGIPITSAAVFAGVWGSTLLNTVKAIFNLFPFFPVYYACQKAFARMK